MVDALQLLFSVFYSLVDQSTGPETTRGLCVDTVCVCVCVFIFVDVERFFIDSECYNTCENLICTRTHSTTASRHRFIQRDIIISVDFHTNR